MSLLESLPTSVIVQIVEHVHPRLYIDFGSKLPPEICLKILSYLDPVSLINVAKSCRAYHNLAIDARLWRQLYHSEGFKVIPGEILEWEAKINSERRMDALDTACDLDTVMHDADVESLSGSIFAKDQDGGDTCISNSPSALSHLIRKGKAIPALSGVVEDADSQVHSTIPKASLRMWDEHSNRWRMNWKYLYSARRKLEANWQAGVFTNFQFPHPDHPGEGHMECVYNLQYDSQYLVSGSRDQTIRIWNLHTRRLLRPPLEGHKGSVLCLQFDADPNEDLIVSGSSDSDVIVWQFSTGAILQRLRTAHSESVLNVKFDRRILVTCSKDKTIKVFNRRPLRYGDLGYARSSNLTGGHVETVNPVPTKLSILGHEPSPRDSLPLVEPYTMIRRLEGHGAAVNAVQIHGREIVSASGDRYIKLWDWPDRACRRTLVGHSKGIACVQYDGRRIVSGSNDFEVKVFDKETGLEVASLRSHTSLVRTVQSGFGDLPYSKEEDMADAKATDDEFFKAVEEGVVAEEERPNRRFARNAGSRRPEDIVAYGAKLPPGGGGGKYGRIVSGSYDQTIVIWRRDKEGIWRAAHTLHQGEAAAAARRHESSRPGQEGDGEPTTAMDGIMTHPIQPLDGQVTAATCGPQSQASFHTLIDTIIPQGAMALNNALHRYPGMLAYHQYIQAAIGREASPFARNTLRQVVATAMVRSQMAAQQGRRHVVGTAASPSSGPAQASEGGSGSGGITQHIAAAQAGSAAAATTTAASSNAPPASASQAQTSHHHPHMVGGDHGPPRIFKLQFDARRIICSSQSSVIVGWDFCSGDTELEEASRFFATID